MYVYRTEADLVVFMLAKKEPPEVNTALKTRRAPTGAAVSPSCGPHVFMVQSGTTMTRITVQVAAAISAPILHNLALLNSASFLFSSES